VENHRSVQGIGQGVAVVGLNGSPTLASERIEARPDRGSAAAPVASAAERLQQNFDCVVMLTWSKWHTEPRSNRYHYATRFARLLPVIFVQAFSPEPGFTFEDTEIPQFTILHLSERFGEEQSALLDVALRERGVMRPLFWVYCPSFVGFLKSRGRNLVVYHATEDFFSMTETIRMAEDSAIPELKDLFCLTDLVIAVSDGVRRSYQRNGYDGPILTVPNGCDFDFWQAGSGFKPLPSPHERYVALYQGGINTRLDYPLLLRLTELLPDWEFWFCGQAREDLPGWQMLRERPGVRYLGEREPEDIAKLARSATVGIIPFVDVRLMRISWPLKAFEYVACGLPVVTTPIYALSGFGDLFRTARTGDEFAALMVEVAPSRSDPTAIERRLACAHAQSYDLRFATVLGAIARRADEVRRPRRLNVLLLHDDGPAPLTTDCLNSFKAGLPHNVIPLAMWHAGRMIGETAAEWDLSHFDVVIHYASLAPEKPRPVSEFLPSMRAYRGFKILVVADGVDTAETLRERIDQGCFDVVYTALPQVTLERGCLQQSFPAVEFRRTHTGYAPEDSIAEWFVLPLEQRVTYVGYRGRPEVTQPVLAAAHQRSIPVDIEVGDQQTASDERFRRMIAACRATLVLDDGSGSGACGAGAMTALFAAIHLRTVVIVFENMFSEILQPDRHCITLRRDLGNLPEIFDKLSDLVYLDALTENAYDDVIASGHWSYRRLVDDIELCIEKYVMGRPRAELVYLPIARRRRGEKEFEAIGSRATILDEAIAKAYALAIQSRTTAPEPQFSPATSARRSEESVATSWRAELGKAITGPKLRRAARGALRSLPDAMRARVKHSLIHLLGRLGGL
jgi:glycosyltransferase involved in cell wall biosynthesis